MSALTAIGIWLCGVVFGIACCVLLTREPTQEKGKFYGD